MQCKGQGATRPLDYQTINSNNTINSQSINKYVSK